MKKHRNAFVCVLTGLSIMLPIAVFYYLRSIYFTYFPFGRIGIFSFLWLCGLLSLLACILASYCVCRAIGSKPLHVASALLSLANILVLVLFFGRAYRHIFPEHLSRDEWRDPVTDFNAAIQRGDHRMVVITSHLGSLQPGWETNIVVYPKVILAEEETEVLPPEDGQMLFSAATNYATIYNNMLLSHLNQGKSAEQAGPPNHRSPSAPVVGGR